MSKAKPLKLTFEAEIDGKKVKLAVVQPSSAVRQHGRLVHAKAFKEAVTYGAMVREDLDAYLRQEHKWDDERQKEYEKIRKTLLDGERKLAKGGIRLKEAKQLAIDMAKSRNDLTAMLSGRNKADAETADAFADQSQFNYLVASCTVFDETGKPVFTRDGEHPDTGDYVEKGTEQYAYDAADRLSELLYGNVKEAMEKLPENRFLRKFNFVDSDLHLVDEKGRKVDEKGRLVNDEGRFVNDGGEYIDSEGNLVDADGRFVVDEEPFLDDDGKPISDDEGGEEEKFEDIAESKGPIVLGGGATMVELTPPDKKDDKAPPTPPDTFRFGKDDFPDKGRHSG